MLRLPQRSRGFTLAEMMVVVAIIGVVSAVGFASLSGYGKGLDTASLARGLQFLMMRARQESTSDNRQRQISCTMTASSSTCQYLMAGVPGMAAQASWAIGAGTATLVDTLRANSHATLWNVTNGPDYNANNAGAAQLVATKTVTFYPDGTVADTGNNLAAGATFYICDRTPNPSKSNNYKVYAYGGTGMARLVARW